MAENQYNTTSHMSPKTTRPDNYSALVTKADTLQTNDESPVGSSVAHTPSGR